MSDKKAQDQTNRDTKLHQLFNWLNLRGFGQSRVATLTIATPFVGYVVLYHEKARDYLGNLGGLITSIEHGTSCKALMSFEMRLHFLYLGLFLLGVGSILYRGFAPSVVKQFSSISDYAEREAPFLTARNIRSLFVFIRSRRSALASQMLKEAPWLNRSKFTVSETAEAMRAGANEHIKTDVVRSYYNAQSRYYLRPLVYSVSVIYVSGAVLLFVPGALFSYRVLCVIFL